MCLTTSGRLLMNTGILQLRGNDAGLAVVLGHEVSRAVTDHGEGRSDSPYVSMMGEERPEMLRHIRQTTKRRTRTFQSIGMTQ